LNTLRQKCKEYFPLSAKSLGIFITTMAVASATCLFFRNLTSSDTHVPLIFVLAVLVTALLTEGYFFGLLAAVCSVFAVNWAFTYPYMQLDFTIYGYPLTFMTMLAVGLATSTLTSRLKAQEKLKAVAEKEKTRANLLRSVSHDLRTPLTSISGSLGMILESGQMLEETECRLLLSDAKKDAEWLCSMVENLLSITRMSDGHAGTLNKREELLEEVLGETSIKFSKRHADVKLSISVPDEPVFVQMDAILIEQVLHNLLENSVIHGKHTSHICIDATDEGEQVRICVRDDGMGIAPALLPVLFEGESFLSKPSDSDTNRFMGIGLSVCKTIIFAHGGSIYARNLPDGGAEFAFILPKGDIENDYS